MLRLSQKPLTSREIAAEMIVQRGLTATPNLMNLMTRRVAGGLRDKRERGMVENAETRGGQWLEWRITN
jgi:hypothetical protein